MHHGCGSASPSSVFDFARHYGYLPKACQAYRAKTKGKVERPFRYIRQDFFLGRIFRNLDDLNAQLQDWLDQVANARVHARTGRVVAEHFAEERPRLQRLPAGPFQAVLRFERRITRDGMISVGGRMARWSPSIPCSMAAASARSSPAIGAMAMEARVLTPLMRFGLLEHRQPQVGGSPTEFAHLHRKTRLFERCLAFEVTLEMERGARH